MPGPVAGMFFYLYLIVYIGRHMIVGWEVHACESAVLAAVLIRQAGLAEGCFVKPLALKADPNSRTGAVPLSCMQEHSLPGNVGKVPR